MFTSFDSLPPSSRVWIYQADRKLSADDKSFIENHLRAYCDQWGAHGHPLKSSFAIAHDYFIILGVDESAHGASGCSIDTSVKAIRDIAQNTGVDFFNRELIAFKKDEIVLLPLKSLKQKFELGEWDENTPVFNNVISQKSQLDSQWITPAFQTWLKRYVPSPAPKLSQNL
jgi:hypothetical protein